MRKIIYLLALISVTTSFANAAQEPATQDLSIPTRFKRMDANQDDKITKAEMISFTEKRFAKLDANSDGTLSMAEIESRKENRAAKREEKINKMEQRLETMKSKKVQ